MNQIFRVIWNRATQSWIAVSELTKAHKKASSSNTIKTLLGGTALLLSLNGAEAALAISDVTSDGKVVSNGATASGNTAIAIGVSTVSGSGFGVAIGKNARAEKGGQSIAIGGGNNSGEGAVAKGSQSIAIGGNTIAEGDSSIAIGGDDVDDAVKATVTYTNPQNGASKTDTIKQAFQDLTGVDILNPRWTPTKAYNAATAIGMKAEAKELAVSMGTLARAQKVNSVALGSGALATLDNAIALGAGSKTDKQGTKQTQTTVQGITYNWAGGDKTSIGDVVSVGSAGFERQIKNVAAGEVSNVSTDAINGSQLYGVLSNLTTGAFLNYAGDNAVQPNVDDTKVIKQSIANNRLDIRGGADKDALTEKNIGVNNENGKLWVKLAKDLKGLNSTNVGGIVTNADGIDMSNKPITNLAAGTNSTDAVNKSQLDKVANNNIKLGGDSGNTDAQQLDKAGGLQFNVKGTNGLTTTASGTDVTVKLDDATKAAVDSIANKIENNKIKLSATNDSTSTSEQDLNKSGGIEFKVKGDNGLTASASGDTVTLKLDDATKAKVDSVDSKIGDNNISLGSDSGSTDTQALTNAGGMKFNIKGENGLTTTASGKDVTVKLDNTTKDKIDNAADKNLSNITPAGKNKIKGLVSWNAKAMNSHADLTENDESTDVDEFAKIGVDGELTLDAGKNLHLKRKNSIFTYGLASDLTGINSITGLANTLPVTKNDAAAPTKNQTAPTGVDGTKAASVNDILNAGWNLKENNTDKDFVKAYDTVKFVDGTGTTANITVTENGAVSAVKFDVKKTTLTADADKGTVSAGNAGDSFATANDVANAINSAFWKVTGAEDGGKFADGNTTTEEQVKAGDKVTFKAGENIKLKQAGKDFTYSLNPVLSNITSIGGNGTTMTFKDAGVDLGGKKITGLAPGEAPTDAVNKSQLDKVATNNIKLGGDSGTTDAQQLDKTGGLQFNVKGTNGLTTEASGTDVTVKLDNATKDKIDNAADKNLSNITDAGKKQIKDQVTWKAKATNSKADLDQDTKDSDDTAETIGADGILTLDAGKNLRLQRKGKEFTYGLESNLTGINSITGLTNTLPVTKNDAAAPTTNQPAPTNVDGTKAASVNDILNAGWNLKENDTDKDFVKAYDTVKFVDGTGTTANVTVTENGAVSAVKFDVKKTTLTADADKGTVSAGNAGDSFATANDVANAINKAFWNATSATTTNGEVSGTKVQPVKAGDTVTFEADKNIKLTQADGKFTFATKDDVEFNTVKVGDKEDGKSPVEFKTEKAKPASNNGDNNPTTALNVSSADGKPTQITGVASSLNKAPVTTAPNGKDGAKPESNLVDLANATTPNAVATVGDLQNMGWIVGAPENGYVDTVKNANKVDFKAGSGVSVTGETKDGVREITIAVKDGEVVKDGDLTAIVNGESTPVTKVGDKYYKTSDIDPKTGKPVDNKVSAVTPDKGTTPVANAGNGYVTGNKVATAIQKSGFVVGKQTETLSDADFKNEDEKVNPNDELRFADGKNTKVKLATKDAVDKEGNKVTTTTVKFDVDTGTVTSNKDGSVSGPVTPDMKKALDDAKKALADATTPEAKKAAQDKVDAAQANIDNVGNPIATVQNIADAINNSGFTLTTSENGGKKLSGKDEIINPGKKVDLAAGKNMTVKQDAEGKVTYATADEVNFSSVQFGDNGPKINAAGDNINIGDKDGNPTKITGVKAGDISPTSTDAVNGAQIYALSRGNVPNVENITVTNPDGSKTTYKDIVVDENGTPILKTYNVQGQKEIITNSVVEAVHNMNEQGIKFFHSNDGVNRPKVETANSFDSSASGKFATAIGKSSVAHGDNAVAMGNSSKALGNDSIAIGTGNIVEANNSGAFGDPNVIKADATGSYAFGNNNVITTKNTFVLGNDVNNAGNSTSREGTVENSVYLGNKSTATAGDGSRTASLYNIKQDGTKGTSTTAGSVGTVTTATVGNMTYGGFQGAKANGVVSVGAAGDERRIQNVAAGEISSTSTDAINGSQLYSVAKGVGNRINNLQGQVNRLGKRMNAGVAGAMAAANLMQPHKPGQSAAMAAVGQHRGEAALAVGYSRISDNGKYGIKLSMGADTQGQISTGAGVSYFW
ncbi:ESPR-type extended signal peptide-containing protein [Haemophilus sp. SZY H36]|uniref:ESPR-type extended signal peptide-containing protein n=1 Tax=Haemophilus sp. SZY H36 TaxID=2839968 RepID=UPI001C05AAC0|nr:ESPR-type extended signal peptide-containing protein [Haemophilus sp. SZY H36]